MFLLFQPRLSTYENFFFSNFKFDFTRQCMKLTCHGIENSIIIVRVNGNLNETNVFNLQVPRRKLFSSASIVQMLRRCIRWYRN